MKHKPKRRRTVRKHRPEFQPLGGWHAAGHLPGFVVRTLAF